METKPVESEILNVQIAKETLKRLNSFNQTYQLLATWGIIVGGFGGGLAGVYYFLLICQMICQ